MTISPMQRLENLAFEAHLNGITQVLLPKGLMTITAEPKEARSVYDKTFAYFWQPERESPREPINREIAAGLMGWKWTTPEETG